MTSWPDHNECLVDCLYSRPKPPLNKSSYYIIIAFVAVDYEQLFILT